MYLNLLQKHFLCFNSIKGTIKTDDYFTNDDDVDVSIP